MFTLQSITGYLIGIICGVLLKSPSLCIQAAPFVVIPLVLYGGLTVNLNTIPAYSSWVQYITPLRYGYNSLLINQLNTDALRYIGEIEGVRDMLGLSWDEKDNAIGLGLLGFGVAVVMFVGLYWRRKMG
jgi:ABC-type multidrug transport system permease subunit